MKSKQNAVDGADQFAQTAQSALTEEASYKLLFDAAPDAILVVGADGIIRRNNSEAERLLDAGVGELIGLPVEHLVPLASRKKHPALREGFAAHSRKRPMGMGLSLLALKLSGREFPVEISLAPSRGDEATASRGDVIVILRDVSERIRARRTERELGRAQALARISELILRERDLEKVLQSVAVSAREPLQADCLALFALLPESNRIVCRAVSGDGTTSMLGQSFTRDEATWLARALDERAPTLIGDTVAAELDWPESSGIVGMHSVIIAPICDIERNSGILLAGSREAHRFTTDDVAFVEAFANVVSNAIQRNQTEEKWLLSQRLESLGQLTGGVAHDFNNLLTVMSGNLQILADTQFDDPYAHRAIAAAVRATQRGAELTGKLLAFSRRQTLRPRPIDVAETIHAFRDLLDRTLGESIAVEVNVAPRLPKLVVDSGQLETALLNLSVNARDAMPNGGKLSIEANEVRVSDAPMVGDPELRAGHYVCISVSDTGEGMTRETIAHAFEPFFTTKPTGKGSGLGLSMVYGFAKQSSGHVTAYSEINIGTTVNLYLPISDELPHHDSVAVPNADTRSLRGNETILVVEDDDGVREVATKFLEALGYTTYAAKNRREALAAIKKDPAIALLFSDVVLGDGDTGPKVAAALRKLKPTLRVLFASGYAKSALPLLVSNDLDFDFLRKPYSRNQLGRSLRTALDAPSDRREVHQRKVTLKRSNPKKKAGE